MPVPVVSLNIYDIGFTTMHAHWQPVVGATGYILSYEPINATEPTKPKEVGFFLIGSLFSFSLDLPETLVLDSPLNCSYELFDTFMCTEEK